MWETRRHSRGLNPGLLLLVLLWAPIVQGLQLIVVWSDPVGRQRSRHGHVSLLRKLSRSRRLPIRNHPPCPLIQYQPGYDDGLRHVSSMLSSTETLVSRGGPPLSGLVTSCLSVGCGLETVGSSDGGGDKMTGERVLTAGMAGGESVATSVIKGWSTGAPAGPAVIGSGTGVEGSTAVVAGSLVDSVRSARRWAARSRFVMLRHSSIP